MLHYIKDTTVTLYCTFEQVPVGPVDPVDPKVSIWHNGVQVVPDMVLNKISTGYYSVDWLVSVDPGDYVALYSGIIAGVPSQDTDNFDVALGVVPVLPDFYCSWDDIKAVLLGLDVGDIPDSLESRVIQHYVPMVKHEIDGYCRQNFNLTEITEFLDGSRTETIVLKRRPIISLQQCVLRVIPSISWYTFKRWRNVNVIDSEGNVVAVQGGPEPIGNAQPPYTGGEGVDYNWDPEIDKADLFVDCVNGFLVIPPRILYLEMQAIPFWNYTFLQGNKNVELSYTYGYTETNFPWDLRMAAARLVAIQVLMVKGLSVGGAGSSTISIDTVSRGLGAAAYAGTMEMLKQQAYLVLDRYRRMDV